MFGLFFVVVPHGGGCLFGGGCCRTLSPNAAPRQDSRAWAGQPGGTTPHLTGPAFAPVPIHQPQLAKVGGAIL